MNLYFKRGNVGLSVVGMFRYLLLGIPYLIVSRFDLLASERRKGRLAKKQQFNGGPILHVVGCYIQKD